MPEVTALRRRGITGPRTPREQQVPPLGGASHFRSREQSESRKVDAPPGAASAPCSDTAAKTSAELFAGA